MSSKTIQVKGARPLLKRIIDEATDASSNLGEVLRLCMRLGTILKNDDLTAWARLEASGYDHDDDLPEYRQIPVEVRGTFYGPFQSGIKNAHIPKSAVDEGHREALFTASIFDPVGELERIAGKDASDDTLQQNWPADAIAYYQQREIYSNGLVLASAWRVLSRNTFAGTLETIRTRILDFALKIEAELGEGEDEKADSEIQPARVNQIFNTTITGGNVAFSGMGDVSQSIQQVNKGDIESLEQALKELGIQRTDIKNAVKAIEEDEKSAEKPGPNVTKWLGDMLVKGLKTTGKVATGAAGGLLAQAIARYYGIG
jgi:hypothetical protein